MKNSKKIYLSMPILSTFYKVYHINKLLKMRKDVSYVKCKKQYQTLNNAGKKAFPTFEEYKRKWEWQNYSGRFRYAGTPLMSFYSEYRWVGYHTEDFKSAAYLATQMDDYIKWYRLAQI